MSKWRCLKLHFLTLFPSKKSLKWSITCSGAIISAVCLTSHVHIFHLISNYKTLKAGSHCVAPTGLLTFKPFPSAPQVWAALCNLGGFLFSFVLSYFSQFLHLIYGYFEVVMWLAVLFLCQGVLWHLYIHASFFKDFPLRWLIFLEIPEKGWVFPWLTLPVARLHSRN